jgi:hypothetical protein
VWCPLRPRLIFFPSLRCKRRLKVVVCEFRNRYRQFESTPLRHRVLSLTILRPNHRIACPCGLTCKYVVAEKTTFVQMIRDSLAISLLPILRLGACTVSPSDL